MQNGVGDLDLGSDASNSSWEDVEDEDTLTYEAGTHSLLLNSLVLEKIFEFLPVQELQKCRLVCREWSKTALLRKLMGSEVEIKISKGNLDKLLKTAQNSAQPFCRKFEFQSVQLDVDKMSKFVKHFGERISSLSIKFCTASSMESVIKIFDCPRLEELTIYGALPQLSEESFQPQIFTRLKVLTLNSSLDYGQVSRDFIRIVLKHAPNMQTIKIGYDISLWDDFCSVVSSATSPKLSHIEFFRLEAPVQTDCFRSFVSKQLTPHKIYLHSCLVSQDFLEQFLLQTYKHLVVLHIDGTQQEVLTKAFSAINLPNLRELSLPVDGIGYSEGAYILQACPKLKVLKVSGLFQTIFTFQDESLLVVNMRETHRSTLLANTVVPEKHREFLKVLSLINLQPKKLEIDLPDSNLNSRCLRSVYARYPNLEGLRLVHNSTKECTVWLTGISHRIYRRIAHCKSFSVISLEQLRLLPSVSKLKDLKHFELFMVDDIPNAELTLLLFAYGICRASCLQELILNNVTATDVSLMTLAQNLQLSICRINGSTDQWDRFQAFYQQHTIKSFLLPPPDARDGSNNATPAQLVGMNPQFLVKIFKSLEYKDIFEARKVCRYWHAVTSELLHRRCSDKNLIRGLEKRLTLDRGRKSCPSSPSNRNLCYFQQKQITNLPQVLKIWSSISKEKETTLAIVSLDRSTLERLQIDNNQSATKKKIWACQQRKMLEYWYYPDGSDELMYNQEHSGQTKPTAWSTGLADITTLITVGSWCRKDNGLLEFLNPALKISTIYLIGLQKEALDIVLPKLTQMINLESLHIRPAVHTTTYCELTKTHLQILRNASFSLKKLYLIAPSEAVEFVKSQRFTLEVLELHSIVNLSDRLIFSMPHLKTLQLDEPLGCLLWSTLNFHSSLKTIGFGRNGSTFKNKSSPKMSPLEDDFEHSATDILCDVNMFLENATCRKGTGGQKSILQQGSGVHAHYGILQGIFRNFPNLRHLELISASGVTDEILTGFSKEVLTEIDIMNPVQVKRERRRTEKQGKGCVSIRNLKYLTHLVLDNQPLLTDFTVLFGILKLSHLEFLSCSKWKISDIAVRALADIVPSLKEINTNGCIHVSKYALEYFKESRRKNRF